MTQGGFEDFFPRLFQRFNVDVPRSSVRDPVGLLQAVDEFLVAFRTTWLGYGWEDKWFCSWADDLYGIMFHLFGATEANWQVLVLVRVWAEMKPSVEKTSVLIVHFSLLGYCWRHGFGPTAFNMTTRFGGFCRAKGAWAWALDSPQAPLLVTWMHHVFSVCSQSSLAGWHRFQMVPQLDMACLLTGALGVKGLSNFHDLSCQMCAKKPECHANVPSMGFHGYIQKSNHQASHQNLLRQVNSFYYQLTIKPPATNDHFKGNQQTQKLERHHIISSTPPSHLISGQLQLLKASFKEELLRPDQRLASETGRWFGEIAGASWGKMGRWESMSFWTGSNKTINSSRWWWLS